MRKKTIYNVSFLIVFWVFEISAQCGPLLSEKNSSFGSCSNKTIEQCTGWSVRGENINAQLKSSLVFNPVDLINVSSFSGEGENYVIAQTYLPHHLFNPNISNNNSIGINFSQTLEPGWYKLIFNQANLTLQIPNNDPNESSLWGVKFGNRIYTGPLMRVSKNTNWQEVEFEISSSEAISEISFFPLSINTTHYLGIDGVQVFKIEGCDSSSTGNNLPSCDSYSSFNPTPGKYVLSAWVKKEHLIQPETYTGVSVDIVLDAAAITEDVVVTGTPSGSIIDGWQQIQKVFEIKDSHYDLEIKLNNTNSNVLAYFDDIRIHPFDGNMKSFVYDPISQRLVAELDENNYATFYEYDQEGGLIRVKKETERGVKTIQETRSGTLLR